MNFKKALEIFSLDSLKDLNSESLKQLYRKLAKERHPDKKGGTNKDFVDLRRAYLLLRNEINDAKNDEKSLQELTKDEILDKYLQVTRDWKVKIDLYEDTIGNQNRALAIVKESVEDIISKFEYRKNLLRKELEQVINSLEKELRPNIFKRLFFFFLPKLNEDEFWNKYQQQVHKFTRKDQELNFEFFKEMLSIYGDGLNDISTLIKQLNDHK